jgi:hypothetical protein
MTDAPLSARMRPANGPGARPASYMDSLRTAG